MATKSEALLIVLVLLGMISMLAGLISVFTKGDAAKQCSLRDELRAPMRLEISNMWYNNLSLMMNGVHS
ncbi:MAG: hypothetical protein R3B45_13395 [Bdellovibrionota bacterium]